MSVPSSKVTARAGALVPIAVTQRATVLDAEDPLRSRRERFLLPADTLYFDGNSLGALPMAAKQAASHVIAHEWGEGLIRSWNEADWIGLARRTGDRIAPIIGAQPGTVICADSTTINLFKAIEAAVALRPDRHTIVVDRDNFPTDVYIAASVAARRGLSLRAVSAADLGAALNDDTAVLSASHVDYRTSAVLDMAGLTSQAHDVGALAVWDIAHSAGAMPCQLAEAAVDFAIGCGYKYLNGGPGAPAFIYVAPQLIAGAQHPLTGWFGHDDPFAFDGTYRAASGIERFLVGTTPVIGMSVLHAALEEFDGVSIDELRTKSIGLTSLFVDLARTYLIPLGFTIISLADAQARGSHVALAHDNALAMMRALTARGVIGDVRQPNLLRFGFAPLYNRYVEVVALVENLVEVAQSKEWVPFVTSERERVI